MSAGGPPRPYGSWPSPISAADVAAHRLRLSDVQLDGDDVLWVEGRPAEGGRCVVVRWRNGSAEDVLPAPWSARTWVHEYGGGAFRAAGGAVHFSNAGDRRLYTTDGRGDPRPLTPELGDVRYADMEPDPSRARLLCVVEDHRGAAVANLLAAVPLEGGPPQPLASGNDFYSSPRVSPDGSQMAWLTWNHPSMPWDGTELWLARLDAAGRPEAARQVAGGVSESVFQPEWSPDGVLHFVSDRTGWWNLYALDGDVRAVAPMDAECGFAQWLFGLRAYGFLDGGRAALATCRDGIWNIGVASRDGGAFVPLQLPYSDVDGCVTASGATIAALAGGPRDPVSVVRIDANTGEHLVLRRGNDVRIDDAVLSVAEPITFPGHDGEAAHGYYYAPRNDAVTAVHGERPPLYVHAHGGPTSACSPALDPLIQHWTSRGFAVLDVDYGGSTGHGRPYRERLRGRQGIVDVGDCVQGARHLAATGRVDGARMFIEGGSAGGYIVLCAMTFHDVFAAGISLFGISDLELLARDTHKFESRYCDSMIGPYPECRDQYRARSPIHFIDRVRRAVFLLQGLDDPIVPPSQAELMISALRDAGLPCAYIGFPGEQHGFRRADTIVRTLESELYFLGSVLGFEPAGGVQPVDIANRTRRTPT